MAADNWYLIPYNKKGNTQPKFSFNNYGSKTLYTADPGIAYGIRVPTSKKCQVNPACKANEKLLYMMNLNDMPPPGSPGSPFKKMQYPPPGVLKPS